MKPKTQERKSSDALPLSLWVATVKEFLLVLCVVSEKGDKTGTGLDVDVASLPNSLNGWPGRTQPWH